MAFRSSAPPYRFGERSTVAVFDQYEGAQEAVDALSDNGFRMERVAIVGSGLRYVEQVSRRVTVGRAALSGAGQGAIIGLVFALLFGIFFTVEQAFLGLVVYSVAVGIVFGAIFGALAHGVTGGRRGCRAGAADGATRATA